MKTLPKRGALLTGAGIIVGKEAEEWCRMVYGGEEWCRRVYGDVDITCLMLWLFEEVARLRARLPVEEQPVMELSEKGLPPDMQWGFNGFAYRSRLEGDHRIIEKFNGDEWIAVEGEELAEAARAYRERGK